MKTIGFIGVGNMGGALAKAVCLQSAARDVVIYDADKEKMEAFAKETSGRTAASVGELVRQSDAVFLCVKPALIASVGKEALSFMEEGKRCVICSIAAGVSLSFLTELFPGRPVVRLMPNIPVKAGKGLLLFAANPDVEKEDLELLESTLGKCGRCETVAEEVMERACPVFSCSPAFVYIFIESLADAGVQIGLEREEAIRYAAQAVLGSAAMVLKGEKNVGELRTELCTPEGMTITATNEMERAGFRSSVIRGILAAYEKQHSMI